MRLWRYERGIRQKYQDVGGQAELGIGLLKAYPIAYTLQVNKQNR